MTQRLVFATVTVVAAAFVLAQAPGDPQNRATAGSDAGSGIQEQRSQSQQIRAALKPLQVVVGNWRGNTFRENVVHQATWAWDFKSDPQQPALEMTSARNPFFRAARLTYDPVQDRFLLVLTDDAGNSRRLEGNFSEEPQDRPGDDERTLQRTYELSFEQVDPKSGEQWRIVLNQQENNRFLFQLARRRGRAPFRGFDTVSSQREGTSFALSDEGYGDKTCIISGGLGTIAVQHAGRTYYVCCSGCQAAFEDDPEKWIAESQKAGKP